MAEHSKAGGLAQIVPTLSYAVVIEWGPSNLSAYVPDLPGCITTGCTMEEIVANMHEAIALHLEGMLEDGEPIPEPRTRVAMIEVQPQVQAGAA